DQVRTDNIMLVTDDVYPETLVDKGHLNHVIRRAIEEGVDPVTAIQMGTINTARYFKLDGDIGGIAPGKCADLLLIDDLRQMEPSAVITNGELVYNEGKLLAQFPSYVYPEKIRQSVHLARPLTAADFLLPSRSQDAKTKVNLIHVIE